MELAPPHNSRDRCFRWIVLQNYLCCCFYWRSAGHGSRWRHHLQMGPFRSRHYLSALFSPQTGLADSDIRLQSIFIDLRLKGPLALTSHAPQSTGEHLTAPKQAPSLYYRLPRKAAVSWCPRTEIRNHLAPWRAVQVFSCPDLNSCWLIPHWVYLASDSRCFFWWWL